jgi:hypothetical protein
MDSPFMARDQLAEARNAITCALTSFVLTSIAIRHAARGTIGAICLKYHSQVTCPVFYVAKDVTSVDIMRRKRC